MERDIADATLRAEVERRIRQSPEPRLFDAAVSVAVEMVKEERERTQLAHKLFHDEEQRAEAAEKDRDQWRGTAESLSAGSTSLTAERDRLLEALDKWGHVQECGCRVPSQWALGTRDPRCREGADRKSVV